MKKLIIIFFIPLFITITGFFSIFQTGKINNDGSGSLNIVYSGSIKEVENNKYSLGHFPFGKKNILENFTSENVIQTKIQVAKPGDTAYMVILDLNFNNLNDLNDLKGFSDFIVKVTKDEKGSSIKWVIDNNERTSLLSNLNFTLSFESDIDSSNGTVKDKSVKWYKNDFSKKNELFVHVKSDLTETKTTSKDSEIANTNIENEENQGNDENLDPGSKDKICGSFGIELPFILLAGFIFSLNRQRKSQKFKFHT